MSSAAKVNKIINADWIEAARRLPDRCVHLIVTSPPYWGQRNYGVEGQLGLEPTVEEHIDNLVKGFRELRRVLRDDGQFAVNYGDKYIGGGNGVGYGGKQDTNVGSLGAKTATGLPPGNLIGLAWRLALAMQADGWILRSDVIWAKAVSFNDKYSGSTMPESINGTRWERCRVKLKPQKKGKQASTKLNQGARSRDMSNGQYLSSAEYQDCPGCPKCEQNGGYVLRRGSWRATRAHEYVFQFVKQIPYFSDMESVKEDSVEGTDLGLLRGKQFDDKTKVALHAQSIQDRQNAGIDSRTAASGRRNLRDVWTINPQSYPDAHYATFPEALIEPIIKVATSQKGCCPECGAQWARVIEKTEQPATSHKGSRFDTGKTGSRDGGDRTQQGPRTAGSTTLGWRPACSCDAGEPVPAVVYDPFMGSGTVAAVAARLGRNYAGSELSSEYMKQIEVRVREAETGVPKAESRNGQIPLFRANP
jgi:DNA modification methylase